MVLKKGLDYGFNGFQVPIIPKAPRSLRRRVSYNKSAEDGQICAFELLATVAGKLLQEGESSISSNAAEGKDQFHNHKDGIKQEQLEESKPFESECFDQGSCVESICLPKLAGQENNIKSAVKEIQYAGSDSMVECSSIYTSSDILRKVDSDAKLEIWKNDKAIENIPNKSEASSSDAGATYNVNNESLTIKQTKAVQNTAGNLISVNTCSLEDPIENCVNTHMLLNSDRNVQFPLYRDPVSNDSFKRNNVNVKIHIRDDDENSSRSNKLSTKMRAFRPRSRIGHPRVRKMLTSKYWKVAPKLKDCQFSNTDGGIRSFYHNRKAIYRHEKFLYEAPSKRRKLFHHRSPAVYDQEVSSESISTLPEKKGLKGEKRSKAAILHRAFGVSSSIKTHQTSFQSKESRVKFSIKSFKVPELYVNVPETETVGLLKRTVMEAVASILGNGLRVGVLLHGKKVRDDNRTLLQTGISNGSDLDSLGFILEPSFTQASPPPKDPLLLLPCGTHQPLSRSPTSPILESGLSDVSSDPPPVTNVDQHVESTHELVPSGTNLLSDETLPDSKALVAIPASVEALAVLSMNQKPKRPELSQRRTRRPFSVSEVEALVEAVERLGTGRWRDVKMRAFDNANHRTYVDLKDKWKTLVHTASISPQQRRGEPVPQELLDRVLAAHAYWSQHQSKHQHVKHQVEPLQISMAPMEGVGV